MKSANRNHWTWAAVLIIGGGALAAWGALSNRAADDVVTEAMLSEVKRGPLTISISEAGTVKAREQIVLKSELERENTILFLIPEGTRVKKGDLLCELDASQLADDHLDSKIDTQNAEAEVIRARENLEVVKNQARSDVADAELNYRFAKEDLEKFVQGDYPSALKEAQAKITVAEEELQRAQEKTKWSEVLYKEKYISLSELQADQLSSKKAELNLDLARNNLKLLTDFDYKRKLDEFQANIGRTEMALDRVTRKAASDVLKAETDLNAEKGELEREKLQLAKIERQISKAKIYAPVDGVVVHATTGGGWRNEEPLKEGQGVHERQDIITLPTADQMMAEVKIHESQLDKVRPGLPVRIKVDALGGKTFTGRVATIAPMPDAQSVWMNPDLKVYKTEVHIDDDTQGLRTGMTCTAEIFVEQYADVTYVPLQSVLRVNGKPTVFMGSANSPREVTIGLDNNSFVAVLSGLNQGEKVLANPPLAAAAALSTQQQGQQPPLPIPSAPAAGDPAATVAPVAPAAPAEQAEQGTNPRGAAGEGNPGGGFDWANATPEQRDQMRQRMRGGAGGEGGGGGGRGNWGGGNPGGGGGNSGGGNWGGGGEGGRPSAEQMERWRQMRESMTPEQREANRQQWMQRRQQSEQQDSSEQQGESEQPGAGDAEQPRQQTEEQPQQP